MKSAVTFLLESARTGKNRKLETKKVKETACFMTIRDQGEAKGKGWWQRQLYERSKAPGCCV